MRRWLNALAVVGLAGCTTLTRSRSPEVSFASSDAALDCAQEILERSGFQVQGDDIGAASLQRNIPGRRATELFAVQENGVTHETGTVRVVTFADSGSYRLRVYGRTWGADGTETRSLLHKQGVDAVVVTCGAARY